MLSAVLLVCLFLLPGATNPAPVSSGQAVLHHHMRITLRPEFHTMLVQDQMTFPAIAGSAKVSFSFLIHGNLQLTVNTPGAALVLEETNYVPSVISPEGRYRPYDPRVPISRYRLTLPPHARMVTVEYTGPIHHPPIPAGDDYGRTADDAAGLISPEGIFLSSASYWYPSFEDEDLQTFSLDVERPEGFDFVSQGARYEYHVNGRAHVVWHADMPQDEIYLVGGRWTKYEQQEGAVAVYAFLKAADAALAERYMRRTAPYIQLYEALLGAYPYPKFALVENFWETGYGMPSFTLLGSSVLRLPFILTTSYPHEILHNWWGNGVYVDYREGNWCEGLTAYMADHLMAEQRNEGALYRRIALKRYSDYVNQAQDFPISQFRERHNPATRAVGYGKTLMFFHMLRLQLGDDQFVAALRRFYQENRFRRVSFSLLADMFSHVTAADVRPFFDQWILRAGAPQLKLSHVVIDQTTEAYRVEGYVEQVQAGPPYQLLIPIALHLESEETVQTYPVTMNGRSQPFAIEVSKRPVRLEVDPEFDIFRRLDRAEIPPTLSEAFGGTRVLFVLPADDQPALLQGYERLANAWRAHVPDAEIRLDSEVTSLPPDRTIWLLGWRNRYRKDFERELGESPVTLTASDVIIDTSILPRSTHSFVFIARQQNGESSAIGFVATDNAAALPGLSRKVPHYDRYSYLAFAGDEPQNVLKGEWPVISSPLSIGLLSAKRDKAVAKSAHRSPLAILKD